MQLTLADFVVIAPTQLALSIRMKVFGGSNLHVAIACEDLAYATYVFEYSSGKFSDAR